VFQPILHPRVKGYIELRTADISPWKVPMQFRLILYTKALHTQGQYHENNTPDHIKRIDNRLTAQGEELVILSSFHNHSLQTC